MLSTTKIERLQGLLLEEQQKLRRELVNTAVTPGEVNVGIGNHMAEDATAAFDQTAAVSLRQGTARTLEQVDKALERMAVGTYGVCARCGEEIDFARLKAIPQATLCMNCRKLAEL
jgi:RNA polymerase-binding protein DksA